jgi:hypothetical protein
MPYIEPVPAAGRYALSKFFLSPDFDTDGDWKLGACVYSAPTGRCPYGNG